MASLKDINKTHKRINKSFTIMTWISLDSAIEELENIKKLIPSDAIQISSDFYVDKSYSYYDSIETELKVDLRYWIPYTEEELAKRNEQSKQKSAAMRKANKEKKEREELEERALFEKLKAKYDA